MNLLITGAAGFIGSHVARHFVRQYPEYRIILLDALTYAGNVANLEDLLDLPQVRLVVGELMAWCIWQPRVMLIVPYPTLFSLPEPTYWAPSLY